MVDKQSFIRKKARQNIELSDGSKVLWSQHAIERLIVIDTLRGDVENAIVNCEIIEDYPTLHRPLPDCLVLGWLNIDAPIHIVIAIDETRDRIFIITVYIPDSERWSDEYKKRK